MKRYLQSNLFLGLLAVTLFFGCQAALIHGLFSGDPEDESARTAEILPGEPARFYWDFWTPEIDTFVEDLKAQRLAFEERKADLANFAARLEAERLELEGSRRILESMREDLEARIVEVSLSEQRNLKSLSQTYSNLSPEAALKILREMDDEVVVKILMHMKPDVVGAIFEQMTMETDDTGVLVKRAALLSNRLRLARRESADNNS
jgi:flagellar motility protein MotE (MotC chaperone)